MHEVDYVINFLIGPPLGRNLYFVDSVQIEIYRLAMLELERRGYLCFLIDVHGLRDEFDLIERFSIVAPASDRLRNWGMFSDTLFALPVSGKGTFFFLKNALNLWQKNTVDAGRLTSNFQTVAAERADESAFRLIFDLSS